MTCKRSLYALAAALALAATATAQPREPRASATIPCIACVTLGVSADAAGALTAGPGVALVLQPGEMDRGLRTGWDAHAVILNLAGEPGNLAALDVRARRALTAARARRPAARLGAIGPRAALDALLARDLAAYVDFVVSPDLDAATREGWTRAHPGLSVWGTIELESFGRLLEDSAASGPALIWPAPSITPELAGDLARLAEFFPEGMIEVSDPDVMCEPAAVCRVRTFQWPDTQERTVWISRRGSGRARATITAARAELIAISTGAGAAPGVADSVLPLAPIVADARGTIQLFLPQEGVSSLFARLPASGGRVFEAVRVVGARELRVEEIVARHQAQAARQRSLVRTLVTHADTTVTFELPAFPAPVAIRAQTIVLQGAGPTELIQRNVMVNGVAFAESGVPRLPLIEPERVAAPPLAITLSRSYRYRLEGRARVNGTETYVVGFEPGATGESLFEGRAWIDVATFALVRVDAIQTNLRGPISASRQIDEFAPAVAGAEPVWLLDRSEIRQVYEGAGITTPILRVMTVRRHEINPPDLDARRRAAYQSRDVILRETPGGLRYLRRDTDSEDGQGRTVAGRATKIRALAGGVIVDPNITRPLPFAGLNYTDFDLAGAGIQLNAFFGGTYGQAAVAVPSVGGSRWQAIGGAFGTLASFHDRAFRDGRERYEENLLQRPIHVRGGVVRPLTPRTSLRAEYVFDRSFLREADTTSAEFVVPSDHVVHAARVAIETQRAGWRLDLWWNPARRSGWRPWGVPGASEYAPAHDGFQRFGASASRPWVVTPRLLARAELAVMGGVDLDRFSRYAFGTFDNRLRGYPVASIRYDRGGVARLALVWQPGGWLRLDGFADAALVREAGFASALRGYPGLGAAVEAPGPFSLLLAAEWGYGVKGINSDGSRGTHVIRVTVYRVF